MNIDELTVAGYILFFIGIAIVIFSLVFSELKTQRITQHGQQYKGHVYYMVRKRMLSHGHYVDSISCYIRFMAGEQALVAESSCVPVDSPIYFGEEVTVMYHPSHPDKVVVLGWDGGW